ncbi:MAG: hypothetical protein ACTS3F_05980 [Phycisphaerales bacterium]
MEPAGHRDPPQAAQRTPERQAYERFYVKHGQRAFEAPGIIIAEYRLPIDNDPEGRFRSALVAYDAHTRAHALLSSRDGRVFMTDANGQVWRGDYRDAETMRVVRVDGHPIDDTMVEDFLPSVIVRDVYERPELLVAAGTRTGSTVMNGHHVERAMLPGVEAELRLPGGERFLDRHFPQSDIEPQIMTIEVDHFGRLISLHRKGMEPVEYTYALGTPAGFPLPDPTHGGKWRLHRWEFIGDPKPNETFTPGGVAELAARWGLPSPDRRLDKAPGE